MYFKRNATNLVFTAYLAIGDITNVLQALRRNKKRSTLKNPLWHPNKSKETNVVQQVYLAVILILLHKVGIQILFRAAL